MPALKLYFSPRRPDGETLREGGYLWIDTIAQYANRNYMNAREISIPATQDGIDAVIWMQNNSRFPPIVSVRRGGEMKQQIERMLERRPPPCAECVNNPIDCGRCRTHHSCQSCTGCNRCMLATNRCGVCGNCRNMPGNVCCACITCRACGTQIEGNAQTECCQSCERCCRCTSQHGESFIDGNHRMIGVEWEYNHSSDTVMRKWARKWRGGLHADGSCGMEAVTPPISGKYIPECLKALGEALREGGATVDQRCGIHVHVSTGDYSWNEMYRLVKVYAKVEPILFILGGQMRVNSTYCKPSGIEFAKAVDGGGIKGKDLKGELIAVALGCSVDTARRRAQDGIRKKDQGRYRGMNILPWLAGKNNNAPDTTVEFRLHRNTSSADRVIGWSQLLVDIVSWCYKASDKEVDALPRSALRALCEISPRSKEYIMGRIRDWRKATRLPNNIPRRVSLEGGCYKIRLTCDALRKKQVIAGKEEAPNPVCLCHECNSPGGTATRFDTAKEIQLVEI